MAYLLAQFQKLQLPALQYGVMQEIVTVDESFNYVPFKDISPLTIHQYNRELTLGSATTASFIAPTGTVSESAPTFTQVSDNVKVILDTVYVPKLAQGDMNVVAAAINAKAKTVGRAWSQAFVNGNKTSDANSFDGLYTITSGSATQDIAAATAGSGSMTLAKIDEAIDAVKAGKPSFIVTSPKQIRAMKSAIRTAGSLPEYITSPNLGAGQVLTYNGIPVLKNEWVSDSDANTNGSSLYVVYANEADGLTGFFNGTSVLEVSGPFEVTQSDMVEYKVVFRTGLSCMSSLAVSRLHGLL